MIEDAEERGLITPGVTTLVEPTSGNLGLGIVLIALRKGYRFVAVVPGEYSLDKQILLRYMGAELYLTGKKSFGKLKLWHHLTCPFLDFVQILSVIVNSVELYG
jgi:cysteine synthase A